MRAKFFWLSVLFASFFVPLGAQAQTPFPSRAISLIIPAPPGGPADTGARIVARALTELLGRTVVADNRPGAGTILGTSAVARAAPDGYTLGALVNGGLTLPTGIGTVLPYKIDDFAPLGIVAFDLSVITAKADSPWKTLKDVAEYAKQHPNKLTYGAVGIGSLGQMGMEAVKLAFGIDMTIVPFAGAAPAFAALFGGHIDFTAVNLSVSLPFIKSGNTKPLVVTSTQRLAALPGVPAIGELGWPDMPNFWIGIFAPSKTPAPVVEKLAGSIEKISKDQNTINQLDKAGFIVDYRSPAAVRKLMEDEIKVIARIAKVIEFKQ